MKINYPVSMKRIVPQELELSTTEVSPFLWEFGFPVFDDVILAIAFLFPVSRYPYLVILKEVNMS